MVLDLLFFKNFNGNLYHVSYKVSMNKIYLLSRNDMSALLDFSKSTLSLGLSENEPSNLLDLWLLSWLLLLVLRSSLALVILLSCS